MKTNAIALCIAMLATYWLISCDEITGPTSLISEGTEDCETICLSPAEKANALMSSLIRFDTAQIAVSRYKKDFLELVLPSGDSLSSLLPIQEQLDFNVLKAAMMAVNQSKNMKSMVIRKGMFRNSPDTIRTFIYFLDTNDNIVEIQDPTDPSSNVKLILNDIYRCPPDICAEVF